MVTLQFTGSDFDEMAMRVNKIMDQMMHRPFFRFRTCERWQPAINLYETNNAYHICIDLAGIDPDNTEIKIENNVLHIIGHRATPSPKSSAAGAVRIHVLEIDHGPFYRAINLPDNVNTDKINAKYRKGLLWIEIPKI